MLGDDLGEPCVLRQKTIAGVNGLGARQFAGGDKGGDVQIALSGWRRPDADAFIRKPNMHRIRIRGRMHRNGLDAHLTAGAKNSESDLATIGDKNFLKHRQGPSPAKSCAP